MQKFNRNYIINFTFESGALSFSISRPLTIEFDINRQDYASCNYASIRLINLSQQHRNKLEHDIINTNEGSAINVELQAGYGNGPTFPVIFKGNVQKGYSHREGTRFVTTLECYDAGIGLQTGWSMHQIAAGTLMTDVFKLLIADLLPYGIVQGPISPGPVPGSTTWGVVSKGFGIDGPTRDVLSQLTNSNFYVDNGVAIICPPGFATGPQINPPVINAQSGLLSTPFTQQSIIDFEMIFEPTLKVGDTINLQSSTANSAVNGFHQIIGINHRGVISDAVAGTATTRLRCRGGVFQGLLANTGAV